MRDVRSIFGTALSVQLVVLIAVAVLAVALARTRLRQTVPRGQLGGCARDPRDRGAGRSLHPARLRPVLHALPRGVLRGQLMALLVDRHADPHLSRAALARRLDDRGRPDRLPGGRPRRRRVVVVPGRAAGACGDRARAARTATSCVSAIAAPRARAREHDRAFRAAVDPGVDLVEFDVLDLPRGPLVSRTPITWTRSATAPRRVRASRTLGRAARGRTRAPDARGALSFFAAEAPDVGLHIDLKLPTRLDELAPRDRALRPGARAPS